MSKCRTSEYPQAWINSKASGKRKRPVNMSRKMWAFKKLKTAQFEAFINENKQRTGN